MRPVRFGRSELLCYRDHAASCHQGAVGLFVHQRAGDLIFLTGVQLCIRYFVEDRYLLIRLRDVVHGLRIICQGAAGRIVRHFDSLALITEVLVFGDNDPARGKLFVRDEELPAETGCVECERDAYCAARLLRPERHGCRHVFPVIPERFACLPVHQRAGGNVGHSGGKAFVDDRVFQFYIRVGRHVMRVVFLVKQERPDLRGLRDIDGLGGIIEV